MSPFNLDWTDHVPMDAAAGLQTAPRRDAQSELERMRQAISEWVNRPEHDECRCAACQSLRRLDAGRANAA